MSDLFYTNANRVDPTRTTMVRRMYEADLVRRFRELKKLVVESIESEPSYSQPQPKTNAFKFERKPKKVAQFMDWLRAEQSRKILGVQYGTPVERAADKAWQNVYIKTAYQKGIAQSAGRMKKGGVKVSDRWINEAMLRPVHADRAGIIYTRAYTDLEGITRKMDQEISRTLALGIAEGKGTQIIAAEIADRIEKIGITRARMLARTEIISAHAEASLNSYSEAGILGVKVLSEFTTAQDNKVCSKCEALEGRKYSVEKARGVIPVHPNCRCAWLPVVENGEGVELR